MPKLFHVEADDEVADLVDTIKKAPESELALVFPPRSRAFQTALNVRLLAQFAQTNGKQLLVISEDPRIQQMARTALFPVYASVAGFERGIQAERPHGSSANLTAAAVEGGATATAVLEAPAEVAPPPPPVRRPPAPSVTAAKPHDRRPLYFAAIAAVVIGLLLLLFVAPTATATVTVAATQLNVSPVIQGTTDPTAASQPDHIQTRVITDTEQGTFVAKPSGQKQVPATASSGQVEFQLATTDPNSQATNGIVFQLPAGTSFTANSVTYTVTQASDICIGNFGQTPPSPCTYPDGTSGAPNDLAPVQATSSGASTNVSSGTVMQWSDPTQDPCAPSQTPGQGPSQSASQGPNPGQNQSQNPNQISGCTVTVTAPSGLSGGADAKTVTVASATDVSSFTSQYNTLCQKLQAEVSAKIASELNGDVVAKDPTGGGDSPPQCSGPAPVLPQANAPFSQTTITVKAAGQVAAYNPNDVKRDLLNDLSHNGELQQGDQILANSCTYGTPSVTVAGSASGTVDISASVTCFEVPVVNLNALASQISGNSPSSAAQTLQQKIPGAQSVNVSIHPFGFILPFISSRISIVIKPQKVTPPAP